MYRYTTPTIPITIADIDFADVDLFRVAIERGETALLWEIEASDSRVDATNNTITLTLTQEETAQFKEGKVDVQVRILYADGTVQATDIVKLSVKTVLDEVVI